MKKIVNFCVLALFLTMITSCEEGFDELNKSKTSATGIDPAFILNNAVINSSVVTLIFEIGIVQQIISPNSGVLTGANFNQDNRATTDDNWQSYYRNVIKHTKDIIARTKDNPARSNLMNMARILQAYAFLILTDTYGDIPYADGGEGYYSQVFFPKYETQQSIYPKIIKELSEASAALNASGTIETADVLYGGDVAKWKKFGYSLMLRAGMRLSAVDATQAQSVVSTAFAGGVITANADNAMVRHDANYRNPISQTLNSTEAANYYLTKPFVDELKNTSDPRLVSIAVRYKGATSGTAQVPAAASIVAADQIGLPMGKDNTTATAAAKADGLVSFYEYSQVDRNRMAKLTAPMLMVTASQTNLLLAEARLKGWISAGTAAQYFADGIKANMDQMASFDAKCAVPAADRDAYIAANPLNTGTELKQINTQYWISSFLNGQEAFANFRRSGFPDLAPNPYPGKEVAWINRLTFPNSEISVNTVNVNAAIAVMGPDNLGTKVWWDK
ncbi:MAG TPA: SusD/RagB family nutrient-binding outer membrane lipoprotein [Prolixibacteraceae bacterium]|nr:SusD/RagB family nutrient-binding outer membrane lipoprotein [Prolixibacteraceae bacterium]